MWINVRCIIFIELYILLINIKYIYNRDDYTFVLLRIKSYMYL